MKKMVLHGDLQSLYPGGVIAIDAVSPKDAVNFLSCVLPGFKKKIQSGSYSISLFNHDSPLNRSQQSLSFGKCQGMHIYPDAAGAKVGGVAAGIAPEAASYESRDDENVSALFNGGVNTTEQGICVPVIYGEVQRAGSATVSSGISIDDINIIKAPIITNVKFSVKSPVQPGSKIGNLSIDNFPDTVSITGNQFSVDGQGNVTALVLVDVDKKTKTYETASAANRTGETSTQIKFTLYPRPVEFDGGD